MAKKRVKRETKDIPKTFEEVSDLIKTLGDIYRKHDNVENSFKKKIEDLKAKSKEELKKISLESDEIEERIFTFMEARKEEVVTDDKKSKDLVHGIIGFRMTPPSVKLTNVKEVLKFIKDRKLKQFVRTKEEVDKEAMLKNQELALTIPGVNIDQKEEMFIKPTEIELEISKNIRNK